MTVRTLSAVIAVTSLGSLVAAQSPATPPRAAEARLTFEVASIKRNVSGEQGGSVRPQPGGRLVITNNSLYNMIRNAYNTQRFEMVPGAGLPTWIDSDRWDITANGPEGATQAQMMAMLQNLLADRFKLVARREIREMPVYALVVARSDGQLGPQLRRSIDCNAIATAARAGGPPLARPSGDGVFCGTRANPGSLAMHGIPLTNFVRNLGGATGRVVLDKTGLTGPFELDLKWTPDQALGAGNAQTDGTSLFAALQEQLGLRLDAQRAPVEVLVINSAERPTED